MLSRISSPPLPEPAPPWLDGDDVFEFWAGNPSVEILHGHIHTATGSASKPSTTSRCSVILASSVPCHMSAPEFCDFVGAFDEDHHRHFRHCRVLRGQSPEEYLVAVWLTSDEAGAKLLEQYNGRRYNSIEDIACSLHPVLDCILRSQTANVSNEGFLSSPFPKRPHPNEWSPSRRSPSMAALPMDCGTSPSTSALPIDGAPPDLQLPSGALPDSTASALFTECLAWHRDFKFTGEATKCPVCLDRLESDPSNYELSELGGGVPLTILCGHTFHARCLLRWCDVTCPVCRYQQHPNQTSCCDLCGQSDGIHICLLCGNIGCPEHAQQHYEEQQHTYALDMTTQHVWDFAGNGYVHRLLTNQGDGKVVEHSLPSEDNPCFPFAGASAAATSSTTSQDLTDFAREHELQANKGSKKSEGVVSEFNMLLASQMTAQRRYFEEEECTLEAKHKVELMEIFSCRQDANSAMDEMQHQISNIIEGNASLQAELSQIVTEEEEMRKQMQSLEALSKRLSNDQRKVEDSAANREEQRKAARQQRDKMIEDLQQQIRDLELYVQMQKKCEGSMASSDVQGSHLLITESSSRGRGRGGRRQRKR